MEASVKQKRRWLIEFGLVSLVPVLLVGLFLGQAIRSSISGSVVDAASDRAQAVADLEVQRALGAHPDAGGAARGRVLRVFAPLRAKPSDRPNGSLELWVPYEPIAARITSRTHGLYWLLGGGLFSLWLLVVGVVAGASQRLRRQAAEKEE